MFFFNIILVLAIIRKSSNVEKKQGSKRTLGGGLQGSTVFTPTASQHWKHFQSEGRDFIQILLRER